MDSYARFSPRYFSDYPSWQRRTPAECGKIRSEHARRSWGAKVYFRCRPRRYAALAPAWDSLRGYYRHFSDPSSFGSRRWVSRSLADGLDWTALGEKKHAAAGLGTGRN